jgi:hypothetical protein
MDFTHDFFVEIASQPLCHVLGVIIYPFVFDSLALSDWFTFKFVYGPLLDKTVLSLKWVQIRVFGIVVKAYICFTLFAERGVVHVCLVLKLMSFSELFFVGYDFIKAFKVFLKVFTQVIFLINLLGEQIFLYILILLFRFISAVERLREILVFRENESEYGWTGLGRGHRGHFVVRCSELSNLCTL